MSHLPQNKTNSEKSETARTPEPAGVRLAQCDPGEYLAILPYYSESDLIRCTVHEITEFRGSGKWKEVSLNQGTMKDQYLDRRRIRGARFFKPNAQGQAPLTGAENRTRK
jgi:hypothetical protein